MARALVACLVMILVAGAVGVSLAGAFTDMWMDLSVWNVLSSGLAGAGFQGEQAYNRHGLYRVCWGDGMENCEWANKYDEFNIDWYIATEVLVGVGILFCFFGFLGTPCYICKKSAGIGRGIGVDVLFGALFIAAGLIVFIIKFKDDSKWENEGAELGWSYYITWGGVGLGLLSSILAFCMARDS